jgi:hypothetical protein
MSEIRTGVMDIPTHFVQHLPIKRAGIAVTH